MFKVCFENLFKRLKAKIRYATKFRFVADCFVFVAIFFAKLLYSLIYVFTRIDKKKVAFICHQNRYSDNPKYIAEALHELNPSLKLVWFTSPQDNYTLPYWMRRVVCLHSFGILRRFYECATASVLVSSVFFDWGVKNFGKQLFISTWHGSLGMKKVGVEIPVNKGNGSLLFSLRCKKFNVPNIMISNSALLSQVYRTGFLYDGLIWRIGYPRCDVLLGDHEEIRQKIRTLYKLREDTKILLYAPTFRQEAYEGKTCNLAPYDIDVEGVLDSITERFGGDWVFVIRWHCVQANDVMCRKKFANTKVVDATDYSDMQELICASDAFISDYSSGIFDAKMAGLPCFVFAIDVEEYERASGLVEPIESYPFPYAKNNTELVEHIKNYDEVYYDKLWQNWSEARGLVLTDHASYDVADVINKFVTGNIHYLDGINNDET